MADDLISLAVMDQVRADLVVRALLDEVEKKEKAPPPKPSEHPLVTLLGTFVLTTVVGTWLAGVWQTTQWAQQQDYAGREQAAKTRLELMTTVTQRVAETLAAGEDVAILDQMKFPAQIATMRAAEVQSRIPAWFSANRRWRVDEKVLLAQTTANFSKQCTDKFRTIIANRNELFKTVNNLLERTGGAPVEIAAPTYKEIVNDHNHAVTVVKDTNDTLAKLSTCMIAETRAEQKRSATWWMAFRRLFTGAS
jgi:hypothetical protein